MSTCGVATGRSVTAHADMILLKELKASAAPASPVPVASEYPLRTVDHRAGRYVVGAVHTQTIEGFWSIPKRGVVGAFHKVSEKYLPIYVAVFQFRYNNRVNAGIFGTAIKGC